MSVPDQALVNAVAAEVLRRLHCPPRRPLPRRRIGSLAPGQGFLTTATLRRGVVLDQRELATLVSLDLGDGVVEERTLRSEQPVLGPVELLL